MYSRGPLRGNIGAQRVANDRPKTKRGRERKRGRGGGGEGEGREGKDGPSWVARCLLAGCSLVARCPLECYEGTPLSVPSYFRFKGVQGGANVHIPEVKQLFPRHAFRNSLFYQWKQQLSRFKGKRGGANVHIPYVKQLFPRDAFTGHLGHLWGAFGDPLGRHGAPEGTQGAPKEHPKTNR